MTEAVNPKQPVDLRLAHLVSNVISPPAVVTFVLLTLGFLAGSRETWMWIGFYVAVTNLIPLSFVIWQRQTGRVTGIHIPVREERYPLMFLIVGVTIASWLVLWRFNAPYTLVLFAGIGIFQAALITAITLFWKISAHTTAISGLSVFISYLFWPIGLLAIPLTPLVAWARIRTESHTLWQTVAGAVAGSGFIIFVLVIVHWQCSGLNFACG
jgi:hypothetical protein